MKVCIVGSGYVGLVAAACLANSGNHVTAVDRDEAKVAMLQRNEIPIFEPGLEELVRSNQEAGRLRFTTDAASAIREAEVVFIAVGTPQDEDGSADLQHVCAVAETIGDALDGYTVVANKSTVPVGTADLVHGIIASRTDQPFSVVSNPEFLKEGAAIHDFNYPDRIVVGAADERAVELMRRLYAPFARSREKMLETDPRSAEMIKYASNAMLATRISFMNELSRLCEGMGADIEAVRRGMGADPRIGPKFLYAGVGFGGSCFPKDIRALIQTGKEKGAPLSLLEAVWRINESQKRRMGAMVRARFGDSLEGRTFAIWGLAFKPQTDDMREAPSLTIIEDLLAAGARLQVSDPVAIESARRILEDRVTFVEDAYDALHGADALLVVTDWGAYRTPDFDRIGRTLREPVIFDGRNLYDSDYLWEKGLEHHPIGRPGRRGRRDDVPAH